jgi:hypothetical protein
VFVNTAAGQFPKAERKREKDVKKTGRSKTKEGEEREHR